MRRRCPVFRSRCFNGVVNIEIPDTDQLLKMMPVAHYGDEASGARGGALHLSAVLPALSAAIGASVATRVHPDPEACRMALGLPAVESAVVVLVDGLGYWNLNMRIGHTPYLRSLMGRSENQRPIATCAPSTTVAAMGTFGTGTAPGLTGMTGYSQRNVETGEIAQLISFTGAPKPADLQREPTVFEGLNALGARVTSVGLRQFSNSPLTQAALRGSDYVSGGTAHARLMNAAKAAGEPGLTYFYLRDVDKVGHHEGRESESWVAALEGIDSQLGLLHRSVPKGTLIVITADHGMISADFNEQIDIAHDSRLSEDVAQVGGEPRAPMLYLTQGADPQVVADRWSNALDGKAEVFTREAAIASGMYGPVDERVRPMLGDVVVQSAGRVTIVDSRSQSRNAMELLGVHGSRTMMESEIPLLVDLVD